jgi:antitoxin CcdA
MRQATNLSLPADLVAEARALGVNLSRACETGLADAVRQARSAQWRAENAEAIQSYNDWIEKNGLPLDDLRLF